MQASDQSEVVSRAFSNVNVDEGPGALNLNTQEHAMVVIDPALEELTQAFKYQQGCPDCLCLYSTGAHTRDIYVYTKLIYICIYTCWGCTYVYIYIYIDPNLYRMYYTRQIDVCVSQE